MNNMLKSFFSLYNNLVFRFFLGIALYLLSVYIMLHFVRDMASLKIINLLGIYVFFYYTVFSIIDGGIGRLASFHIKNNSINTNKQPIRWYLSNQLNISRFLKLMFNLFYVYACFMYLMYMP
ncbi:hypothetical protein D6T91_08940 [Salmonella enterica subsp. houtenae]|nr:hypothetical protein [Salmonella enterica subsp. houtenae]